MTRELQQQRHPYYYGPYYCGMIAIPLALILIHAGALINDRALPHDGRILSGLSLAGRKKAAALR